MERKRSQNSVRKIKLLLMLMLITTILAITATYAWFSSQREVEISGIKLNIEVAESMQISLDGATWYQSITVDNMRQFYGTYSDSTKPHADKDTNTNYVPTELIPASTVGTVSGGKMQFMTGDATLTGTVTSATVKPCNETDLVAGADIKTEREANNENHPYLVFDMYLRNYSQKTEDELQLKAGSRVWVDSLAAETQEGKGKEGTGLENCARVGFVIYDNTADVTASATDIRGLTATNPSVVIWEPNYREHIAEVVSSGRATANTTVITYGVKYSASEVTIANVDAGATDTTNLSQQYTFKPDYWTINPTEADDPLLLETKINTTMKTSVATPANVTIQANKVTKVRVYIWLEGQDVDCINTASQGDRLQVNLKLTKPEYDFGIDNTYTGRRTTEAEVGDILTANEVEAVDYGEYVTNYTPTNGVNDEGIKWRIFHTDRTNIYLIADDSVPLVDSDDATNRYVPYGRNGATYSGIPSFRGFSIPVSDYVGWSDISSSSIATKWLSKYVASGYSSEENNMKATAYLLDTDIWSGFKDSSGYAEYAIGGPTLELFVASYNATHKTDLDTQVISATGYQIKLSTSASYSDSVTGLDGSESLYFSSQGLGFRFATPHVYTYQDMSYLFGVGTSNEATVGQIPCGGAALYGARPIISLNSNIQLEKQEDGTFLIVE